LPFSIRHCWLSPLPPRRASFRHISAFRFHYAIDYFIAIDYFTPLPHAAADYMPLILLFSLY